MVNKATPAIDPAPEHDAKAVLLAIYEQLHMFFGAQRWWPSRTGSKWEVMLGAVLTQHTSWVNVARALSNLAAGMGTGALENPEVVAASPEERLAELLRPAGFHTSKPRRVKELARFVLEQGGLEALARSAESTESLRRRLLSLRGIGPETADAILLYALDRPMFVADAYARRLTSRWELLEPTASYDTIQKLFMDNLGHDTALYNEYHALIVAHAKAICRPRPFCPQCPLNKPLPIKGAVGRSQTWICPKRYTGQEGGQVQ